MKNQLNALAAALSMGSLWSISMLLCTLFAMQFEYADQFMTLMTDVYPGYELTGKGAVIGMLYGFADGFLGGYLIVWLYNFFVRKLSK